MRMMKVLTIFLIGLITLTTINTALAVAIDNDTLSNNHSSAHIGINLPHHDKGALTIPINKVVVRDWNYVDIEIT